MIEITGFLLKHLYELMADDYNSASHSDYDRRNRRGSSYLLANQSKQEKRTGPQMDTSSKALEEDQKDESQVQKSSLNSSIEGDNGTNLLEDLDEACEDHNLLDIEPEEANGSTFLEYQCAFGQSSEQEANQQIVLFLVNNHLPDLICETFIELLFLSVFVALTWIFMMIIQLHCQTANSDSMRYFHCNTKFLDSLMYCHDKFHLSTY